MSRSDNLFIVKAFASQPFTGNPAAVCILDRMLPGELLQRIARELNQPITSFIVPLPQGSYELRHYGPKNKVEICGHGTVAASHVVKEYLRHPSKRILFHLGPVDLQVKVCDKGFELEIPAFPNKPIPDVPCVIKFLGRKPHRCYRSFYDVVAEYRSEEQVRALRPDFSVPLISSIRALLATAPGRNSDYVYRVFAPSVGVDEDYFCGSANGALGPLWSERLDKCDLLGYSVSERGGPIPCRVAEKIVRITGGALTWFSGTVSFETDLPHTESMQGILQCNGRNY